MAAPFPSTARRALAWDLAVVGALAVGITILLLQRPPTLDYADEAYVLYEAKRLLQGEVLYRDVFEIITPLFLWLVSGLYAAFGVDIAVARGLAVALQVGAAAATYACCRCLDVRRSLAALTAAAALTVCQPFWPIASPHWQSTLLVQTFLLSLLWARPRGWSLRWLVSGLVLGLLASTQHQKAAPFALLGAALIAFDVCTTVPAGGRGRAAARAAAALAVGTLAVLGPVLAVAVAQAGFAPVYEGLIRFPLSDYRQANRTAWGADILPHPATRPASVRALQWVLPLLAARLARAAARRDWGTARGPFILLAAGVAAMASIAYFPDVIHLAFIGGVFAVGIADCVERGVRVAARRWPPLPRLVPVLAAAGLLWSGLDLRRVSDWTHVWAPARLDTAFGRVATNPLHMHGAVYAHLQALVDRDPDHLLFVYPWMSSFYLMTGARNPTPFQCMQPGYLPPAYLARATAALDAAGVRTVLFSESGGVSDAEITRYLAEHYTPTFAPKSWPAVTVYERTTP